MANLRINNEKDLKGYLTASTKRDRTGNVIMSGEFYTHKYIEEVYSIETDRFKFENVELSSFAIGSNDYFIKYSFDCPLECVTVKGGETNLPPSLIKEIEKELFKDEENELFHINRKEVK